MPKITGSNQTSFTEKLSRVAAVAIVTFVGVQTLGSGLTRTFEKVSLEVTANTAPHN